MYEVVMMVAMTTASESPAFARRRGVARPTTPILTGRRVIYAPAVVPSGGVVVTPGTVISGTVVPGGGSGIVLSGTSTPTPTKEEASQEKESGELSEEEAKWLKELSDAYGDDEDGRKKAVEYFKSATPAARKEYYDKFKKEE